MTEPLTIPSDPNAELFYDSKNLRVDFRSRSGSKKPQKDVRATALRVVVQCYGWVIEDRFFDPGSVITVGPGKGSTLRIPTKDLADRHPLIDFSLEGTVRLTVNQHFSGVLQKDDQLQSLEDAISGDSSSTQSVQLPRNSRGVVEHGNLRIYFEEIVVPDKVPPIAIWKSLTTDPYFYRWQIASLAIHLLLLIIIKLLPAPPEVVDLEELSKEKKAIVLDASRFKKIQISPNMRAISATGLKPGPVGREGEGARAPGVEGRRGRGVPGAGRMTQKDINKTGVLDFFTKGKNRGVLSDLVGGSAVPGSVESALNRQGRFGLPGERELRSGKGLVDRGGTGGGGLSTSIGQGLGTKGRGGGAKGPGLADFGTGRSNVAVSASIDEEEVYIMGNIPREVIQKIINDHLGQIRYCYERQVQMQPSLRGKIVPTFIIGLQGRVTSTKIKKSTMGSPPVEGCVMNVLRRIQFPKPGGGIVEVTYPFLFRVAG